MTASFNNKNNVAKNSHAAGPLQVAYYESSAYPEKPQQIAAATSPVVRMSTNGRDSGIEIMNSFVRNQQI